MKLPDTLRGRLFGLVVLTTLVSHVSFAMIMLLSNGWPPARPPGIGLPDRPLYGLLAPLIGLGMQFVIITIGAWFGSRWLVRPIEALAAASARLGENLHTPPVPEHGPREMRQAVRTLNKMQRQLETQMAERTRFLAAVSHDLRTPLTRIRLRIEQVQDARVVASLRQDISEMTGMLDGTLDYLRGESSEEAWQTLDVGALLQTMVDDMVEQGHAVTLQGEAPHLLAQPSTLRRGVQNLLDNAVRYGGGAEVSLRMDAKQLHIQVRDHGPGIPVAELNRVLEPFVRLESSRNRHTGGIGLGLSISRDCAARHGGNLSLGNAEEGGLIAELTLPLRRLGNETAST